MKPASAADLVVHFGMTARYWTRMAAEGKVPSAWQPSGGRGKWLFDLQAVSRWRQDNLKKVTAWHRYTNEGQPIGGAPSVTGKNIDSPSAPRISELLKSVCSNG